MATSKLAAALALVLGGVIGWALGRLDADRRGEAAAAPAPASTPAERAPAPQYAPPAARTSLPGGSGDGGVPRPGRVEPPTPRESVPADVPLIHAGLLEYARKGIARGWAEARPARTLPKGVAQEGLGLFEETVLEAPERIGGELGRREEKLADRASLGDVFLLLAQLEEADPDAADAMIRDADAFAALFAPRTTGPTRSGLDHIGDPSEGVEDGTTLQFPAGVFRVGSLSRDRDAHPRDVTLRGAGIDNTLLVIEEIDTRGVLVNFAILDCTVLSSHEGGYLFDMRTSPSSVYFQNVRFLGFDRGAGASCLLASPSSAFLARSCQFLGGYGHSPGSGSVFDVRGAGLLARFERCLLAGVDLGRVRSDARVLLAACELTDVPHRLSASVVLQGTTVTYHDPAAGPFPRHDLDDLFPDWRARMRR